MADVDELAARYDEVNEACHEAPTPELLAQRADLAVQLVEARKVGREKREAEALTLPEGDGVARPRPVEGGSEVSS